MSLETRCIDVVARNINIFPSLENVPLHIADAIVARLFELRAVDIHCLR